MFTVVITEQEHLDNINEYRPFLKPFLESSQIAFCRWETSGETLNHAVPDLIPTVSRHDRWRMIVVCNEDGLKQKNPFNIVKYAAPECSRNDDESAYLRAVREAKFAAYDKAAKQPLVRLMTWMCQTPTVTEGKNNAQADPEFAEYMALAKRKEQLRMQIIADYTPEITLPCEIICVAKRCFDQTEYDIQTAWSQHQDSQYSRFYDWNMYFDKMRYLVFDILPKSHRNYPFDYIRFLYTLMLLAENDVPQSSLNPNRVYSLHCATDEVALRKLLERYDAKLSATQVKLRSEINSIERKEKRRLSDRDVEKIFCSNMVVPVTNPGDFDQSTLYVSKDGIGMATDCPTGEEHIWESGYESTSRSLVKYLKIPRRALKKTSADLRRLNVADLDYAGCLNEFQLEDVADYVGEEELKMVSTDTGNLHKAELYTKDMESQNKRIRTIIEKRMTRKKTITVGCIALACYAFGVLPLFFSNANTKQSLMYSLIILAAGLGIMALTGLLTLLFFRRGVRASFSDYNGIMKGIVNDVEGSLNQYSIYLSHACNVMRGNSVLNYRKENENPDEIHIRILNKHLMDLQCVREELWEVFGTYMPEPSEEVDPSLSFHYDFNRPVDFTYPVPYDEDQKTQIDFLQMGNRIEVPVSFVRNVSIRREGLYD